MNAVDETETEVRRIPLTAIIVDPAIQQRAAGTSQDVVADYADAMRDGLEFPPIDVFGTEDGGFYPADAFIASRHTDQHIPTRKKSNAGFIPAIVTMRCCSPAARTRSTDCGATAQTRRKRSRRCCAASDGRNGVIARSLGNVGSPTGSSLPFAAPIWKRVQMSVRRRTRPPPPRTPVRQPHRALRRTHDARSGAAAGVTA
jgi:hypothetical protein